MALVLEFLYGSIKGERRFDGNLVHIGRDPEGDIAFDFQKDPAVSFNHAVIETSGGRSELKDLGSTNGTLVNGKKITSQILVDGDIIAFGVSGPQVKVRLELSSFAEPAGATRILTLDRPMLRLEIVGGQGLGKKYEFELAGGRVVKLGREKNNDVSFFEPPSPVVSRYHAEITKVLENVYLEDLGSTNGSFVDGKKISGRTALKNGDKILLGKNGPELVISLDLPKPFAPAKPVKTKKTGLLIAGGIGAGLLILSIAFFLFSGPEKPEKGRSATAAPALTADMPAGSDEFAYVERRVKELSAALYEDSSQVKPSFVSQVIEQIDHLKKDRRLMQILFEKGRIYLPGAMRALKRKRLPAELAFLAFIESRFDSLVKSPSGAVGLWQFMIPTAKDFGLRVEPGRKVDERTNPTKATEAAAKYLDFLIRDRGSAFKAIASYNTGQGSVSRASRKVEDYLTHGNYFYLSQKGLIPKETRDYVPRFLAVAILYTDPERFGLSSFYQH